MSTPVNKGVTCLYGIGAGQQANLFVQSYTLTSGFNTTANVDNEDGVTVTSRYDNRRSELMIEGVAKASAIPTLGANISFTVKTNSAYPGGAASTSFAGVVTKVDDRGSSKGFVSVSITAESFEEISY